MITHGSHIVIVFNWSVKLQTTTQAVGGVIFFIDFYLFIIIM